MAVRSRWRRGERHGDFESFHPDGSDWIDARYRKGLLHGVYSERREGGSRTVEGKYEHGQRFGEFTVRGEDGLLRKQEWEADRLVRLDGIVVHPRSRREIREALASIADPARTFGGDQLGRQDPPGGEETEVGPERVAERDRALRRLMAHRYLAEVPWDDLVVSARFDYHATRAAELLAEIGELTARPQNPGWADRAFEHAKLGVMGTNQTRAATLVAAIDQGMAQYGSGGVGFRTSLLDPELRTTGFGRSGDVNAIWWDDRSRRFPDEWEAIHVPPRGFAPLDFFGTGHSWSIESNPANHAAVAFQNEVSIEVYRLDQDWVRDGAPLELEFEHVHDRTLAFRPKDLEILEGDRFEVRLPGIRHDKVGSARTWFVEFVRLAGDEDGRALDPGASFAR